MSEEAFPGSSADFYERIQVLKAEIERLTRELKREQRICVDFSTTVGCQQEVIAEKDAELDKKDARNTELADALSHYSLLNDFKADSEGQRLRRLLCASL